MARRPIGSLKGWSIGTLLTLSVVGVVVLLVVLTTVLDVRRARTIFRNNLEERASLVAGGLNDTLGNYVYFSEVDALKTFATQMVQTQHDITYVRISGPDGRVLADSQESKHPAGSVGKELGPSTFEESSVRLAYRGGHLDVASAIKAGNDFLGVFEFTFSTAALDEQVESIILDHVWQGLVVVVIGIVLSTLIARYATNTIRRLTDAAETLGGGNLEDPVPIEGTRETEVLGRALETMRVQLHDLYVDLERLVAERTVELSDANETLRGEIAERMKAEDGRRALEVKALAQSKLATLGQVATGVAHEVNQPLTFINTMIQGVQEDLELGDLDEEALKKRLAQAVRQVERINAIVTHLRTFGRADEAAMREVSLATVLDNTLLLLGESLRLRNVKVERRVEEGVPAIWGNANQLEQVFINMVKNSVDAFPDGTQDATVGVGLDQSEDGTTVRVTFSDNGVGIAPAHLPRIYEPFFTTKAVGEGTGLGLSIVYGIVADHDGTIECQSEYTKGTTFTVTLPVAGA